MSKTLTPVRWRRYGQDRLFFKDPQGQRVAMYDLRSGSLQLEDSDLHEEVMRLIRSHYAKTSPAPPPPAPKSIPSVPASRTSGKANDPREEGTDLAANKAGESLQREAEAAWQVAQQTGPVRAFVNRYLFDSHTDERAWRKGAEGERRVGAVLDSNFQGDGWHVLHSIPLSKAGTDIDHLFIGPPGVFSINTKMHADARITVYPGSVYVKGTKHPYVQKSRAEADRATKRLNQVVETPISVTPVLCFVCASCELKKGGPTDVMITRQQSIKKLLRRLPPRLDSHAVEQIYTQARRPDTWLA